MEVQCPACGEVYHAGQAHLGKHIRCKCGRTIAIVGSSSSHSVHEPNRPTPQAQRQRFHTLVEEIAFSILVPAARKRIFGRSHLPFPRYLGCYQRAFETGAVLGYAFRNKMMTFARLFSDPGQEAEIISIVQEHARQSMADLSAEPQHFFELAMDQEEKDSRQSHEEAYSEIYRSGRQDVPSRVARFMLERRFQKVPLQLASLRIQAAVCKGIGFGSAFPTITEKLWQQMYEKPIDGEKYQAMRVALNLPEKQSEPIPLAQRQGELLALVKKYVSERHPELLPQMFDNKAQAGLSVEKPVAVFTNQNRSIETSEPSPTATPEKSTFESSLSRAVEIINSSSPSFAGPAESPAVLRQRVGPFLQDHPQERAAAQQMNHSADCGPAILADVRAQMQIDEAWALVEPRGFTWWGHRLAQRVWADPAQKWIGLELVPIAAETDLLVNVPNEPKTAEAVAVLNSTAALSAVIWRPEEGRVSLRCSASTHSEIQGWMTKMFYSAAAMQIAEAEGRADTLQKMIGGRVHTSAHPVNGSRGDPDDMLNVLSVFTTPKDATSPFAGDEMAGLLTALEDKAVATGDGSGITVEFPFPGARPPTVLVRARADVPHPTYGAGALLIMRLPSLPSDIPSGATLANILNQGEIGEIEAGYGFGAWCLDVEDRKSTAYVAFLPASIYMPGLLESIVISLAAKAQWAHQFLGLEE